MPGTELLAPLGCGVTTGAGAVLNAFEVGAGSSIAVFGTGAVGMAAVMAGRAAGAATIIGVDVVPSRLLLAAELGAIPTACPPVWSTSLPADVRGWSTSSKRRTCR